MAAEAKTVAHRVLDFTRLRHVRRIVQITFGIRRVQVDRWRDGRLLYRLGRQHQLDSSTGSEGVAERRLRAANANLVGIVAEDPFDSLGFGFIAQRRAGAMSVDVIDL